MNEIIEYCEKTIKMYYEYKKNATTDFERTFFDGCAYSLINTVAYIEEMNKND